MDLTQLLKKPVYEPFPFFFSVGWLMAFLFIGIWPAYALLHIIDYPGLYHAQGVVSLFIGSFAIGFLLTALPRFTGSNPATAFDVTTLLSLILAEVSFLLSKNIGLASLFMGIKFLYVAGFAITRLKNGRGAPPPSFIWVLTGLLSVTIGAFGYALSGTTDNWFQISSIVPLFRALIFQGFLTSLFLGVGGKLMPFLTSMSVINKHNQRRRNHIAAAMIFFTGLTLNSCTTSHLVRLGFLLQAGALIFEIGYLWGLSHLPGEGVRSRLLWASSWLLTSGYLLSGIFPNYSLHLMHLTFIGGLASGTILVASHVTVSHKDLNPNLLQKPWPLGGVWIFLILAAFARATATMTDYINHLGYAGLLALVGLIIWARYFGVGLIKR